MEMAVRAGRTVTAGEVIIFTMEAFPSAEPSLSRMAPFELVPGSNDIILVVKEAGSEDVGGDQPIDSLNLNLRAIDPVDAITVGPPGRMKVAFEVKSNSPFSFRLLEKIFYL